MKTQRTLFTSIFLILSAELVAQNNFSLKSINIKAPEKAIIEVEMTREYLEYCKQEEINPDSLKMYIIPLHRVGSTGEYKAIAPTTDEGKKTFKGEFRLNNPLLVRTDHFYIPMLSPEDSIYIRYSNGSFHFSGKGAAKCTLVEELREAERSLKKPTQKHYSFETSDNYNQWLKRNDELLKLQLSILDSYKQQISGFEYDYQRSMIVSSIELNKINYFFQLWEISEKDSTFKITKKDLCTIWDSTQYSSNRQWLTALPAYLGPPHILYYITMMETKRKYGFDTENEILRNKEGRTHLYYEDTKKRYNGLTRERALAYIMDEPVITELGLQSDLTQQLLADYYAQPDYPEFKDWVRQLERQKQLLTAKLGAVNFTLQDVQGLQFTKDNLKGKIAFLDFWFTGCKPCMETMPYLQQIEDAFKSDTNVIMVSISTDLERNTWLNSVAEGKYTTKNALTVYTNGEGQMHSMLKFYRIEGYPAFHLLDPHGKLVQFPLPDPGSPEGAREIIKLIKRELEKKEMEEVAQENDGPYISYDKGQYRIIQITNHQLVSNQVEEQALPPIYAATDRRHQFIPIKLQDQFTSEPAEFAQPKRLLVFSDIEGNFDALRKLLQNNGVIDSAFDWIFGKGHLIFAGDMFDRGNQVTECLWLLYSLEEKAKSAGGYVHFILGNHELMNLSGKHKYARDKYVTNAKLINKTLRELYNENSELGRWLRTKNVMEKIGDMLFMHAGVSAEINRLQMPINEINKMARLHYDDSTKNHPDPKLNTIMSTQAGPFWFRGYYQGSFPDLQSTIDSTLTLYSVNHIITGHTIVADTISVHHDGKVFNTDTHHAGGKSEALLLEDNCFYRVNAEGKKVFLFRRKRSL